MVLKDRHDAGIKLAALLKRYRGNTETVVIGLPRGGVETAFFVAQELELPLDITIPRKIGDPLNPEVAIGSVSEEGLFFPNNNLFNHLNLSKDHLRDKIIEEIKESERRKREYKGSIPSINLEGKTVIIVDDGIATGSTMEAAVSSIKKRGAKKIVVAVPVLPAELVGRKWGDEIVYLFAPESFRSVGEFYQNFDQVDDEKVKELIKR